MDLPRKREVHLYLRLYTYILLALSILAVIIHYDSVHSKTIFMREDKYCCIPSRFSYRFSCKLCCDVSFFFLHKFFEKFKGTLSSLLMNKWKWK